MLKNYENNGTDEIGLVTPISGLIVLFVKIILKCLIWCQPYNICNFASSKSLSMKDHIGLTSS